MKGEVPVFRKHKNERDLIDGLATSLKNEGFQSSAQGPGTGREFAFNPQIPYLSQLLFEYVQYFKGKKIF